MTVSYNDVYLRGTIEPNLGRALEERLVSGEGQIYYMSFGGIFCNICLDNIDLVSLIEINIYSGRMNQKKILGSISLIKFVNNTCL